MNYNTYFLIQAGTGQDGFSPIDWPDAKAITDGYNSGDSNSSARMYVILNAEMEKVVHDGLSSMGLTGQNGIAFWLGLFQTSYFWQRYATFPNSVRKVVTVITNRVRRAARPRRAHGPGG